MDDYLDHLRNHTEGSGKKMTETRSQNAVVIERIFDAPVDVDLADVDRPRTLQSVVRPQRRHHPRGEDGRPGRRRPTDLHGGEDARTGRCRCGSPASTSRVVEHERLVYTEAISDEAGNVARPPSSGMPDGHPTATEVRVELEDLGGRTRMVLTHVGVPAGSPGAAGWAMALDKLAVQVRTRLGDEG